MILHEELIKQPLMDISLKIRFDHKDGSYEELLGTVEEGKIHFSERHGYLDLLITYKSLIMPLPYITVFIGIKDLKHDNIVWFNQGKFRIVGDYSYTDIELKQLHFVALNDSEEYKECVSIQKEKVLDNDFMESILISESKDLINYDQQLCNEYKKRFYITIHIKVIREQEKAITLCISVHMIRNFRNIFRSMQMQQCINRGKMTQSFVWNT